MAVGRQCLTNSVWTAATSKRTAPPWEQEQGRERSDRTQPRRRTGEDPRPGPRSWADDRGRPVAILLTPGNVSDIVVAERIVGAVAPSERLLADRAYDAEPFRFFLRDWGTKVVFPSTRSRKTSFPLDRRAYTRRNIALRLFC